MADIVLLTGGARSGKSGYAQKLAEALPPPRVFLATCLREIDDEMEARIGKHVALRAGRGWQTIEEPLCVADALGRARASVVLVDCIALWVANLMMDAQRRSAALTEDALREHSREILRAAERREGTVLLVTNEVGQGVVPDNTLGRLYRDLLGRANQELAFGAHTVILMTCGLPLALKGSLPTLSPSGQASAPAGAGRNTDSGGEQ